MLVYKFKEKGPAFGLGYTEGELLAIDKEGIEAYPLVPEITKDQKGNVVQTGRMIHAKKMYTPQFLIESGVIVPASDEETERYEAKVAAEEKAAKAASKPAKEK